MDNVICKHKYFSVGERLREYKSKFRVSIITSCCVHVSLNFYFIFQHLTLGLIDLISYLFLSRLSYNAFLACCYTFNLQIYCSKNGLSLLILILSLIVPR